MPLLRRIQPADALSQIFTLLSDLAPVAVFLSPTWDGAFLPLRGRAANLAGDRGESNPRVVSHNLRALPLSYGHQHHHNRGSPDCQPARPQTGLDSQDSQLPSREHE